MNWKIRTDGFLDRAKDWFKDGIMNEKLCEGNPIITKQSGMLSEPKGGCNVDQRSFKAYLARFMGLTVKMAPYTADTILPLLETSAVAAAKSCSNGPDSKKCGMKWTTGGVWDELFGLGEQMAALETIQVCSIPAHLSLTSTINKKYRLFSSTLLRVPRTIPPEPARAIPPPATRTGPKPLAKS